MIKTIIGVVSVLCVLIFLPVLSTGAAADLGDPMWSGDVEGYDKSAYDPIISTGFDVYPGGSEFLKVADITDPASKNYVIQGKYSVYFLNVGGNSALDSICPMGLGRSLIDGPRFQQYHTYIVRFLLKQIEPFGSDSAQLELQVYVADKEANQVRFKIDADNHGDLRIACTQNAKTHEKGAIQKIDKDLYEVAIRFTGVEGFDPATFSLSFLRWNLIGEGGFAVDDVRAYESTADPQEAFELVPGKTSSSTTAASTATQAPAGDTTPTDGGTTTKAPAGNTTTTKAPAGDTTPTDGGNTTKAPADNTNTTTKAPATDGVDDGADDQDAAGGLSGPALIALIVGGVVVLGAAAFIVVIVIRRKKGDIAE